MFRRDSVIPGAAKSLKKRFGSASALMAFSLFGWHFGSTPVPLPPKPPAKAVPRPPIASSKDPYWVAAKSMVDRNVMDLLQQDQTEIAQGVRYSKFMRGDPSKKMIAITFDDGPHPAYTPQLLEILKHYNAKATFFLVGEMAEKHPNLVKDEVAAGMAIGNHTYHHVNLTKVPPEKVATEIKACGMVLKSITRHNVNIFRPPGGDYDKDVAQASSVLGYKMILWTDDPGDYASPGKKVIQNRLLDRVSNGGIILIHDGIQQTVDVLPQILQYLKGKGFQFVTIPELMKASQTAGARSTHASTAPGPKPASPAAAATQVGRKNG